MEWGSKVRQFSNIVYRGIEFPVSPLPGSMVNIDDTMFIYNNNEWIAIGEEEKINKVPRLEGETII